MANLILFVVFLSTIVAIFSTIIISLKTKTIQDGFRIFICSFLGGLLGGFIGAIASIPVIYLWIFIFPPQSDLFLFPFDINLILIFILFIVIGVIAGGLKAIKH